MNDKDIKDILDEIDLTDEKIDKLEEKLLREKRKMEKNDNIFVNKNRFKKALPIAAALTVVVSSTIMAYKGVNFNFLNFLRERNVVTENLVGDLDIDEYVNNIEKEVAGGKGNLVIDQSIMDKDTVLVYMTLESKGDIKYDEENYYSFKADEYDQKWYSEDSEERSKSMDAYANGEFNLVQKGSTIKINGEESTLIKGNPRVIGVDGNKINLVFTHSVSEEGFKGFDGSTVDFDLKDFGYYKVFETVADDGEKIRIVSDEFVSVVDGNWSGSFKLEGKSLPVETHTLNSQGEFKTRDGEKINALVKDVEISNLSLKVKLQSEKAEDIEVMTNLIFENTEDGEVKKGDVKLKNRNGQIVETKMIMSGMLTSSEDGEVELNRNFNNPINLKEVEAIIIWGQEFKLK